MLTISKPLSAGQAHRYHQEEFANARENYYTSGDTIRGQWQGTLAHEWGLAGEIQGEHFERLAEGQHPLTGESLVRHRAVCTYTNDRGETVTTMAHRAGWDATFSAPKSVSLTALVGGDERVREAHQESVSVALGELEDYVQARRGDHPAEITGRWVAARFEHDSARPVHGYAAPQLHTHVLIFNVTRTDEGEFRPLQPRELFRSQQFATAIYRSELALRLRELGYEIERGESGQPEILGYTPEYLEASSPRRQQIEAHLEARGLAGAGASEVAAHQTREAKVHLGHEEMQLAHKDLAHRFGQQPERVIEEAHAREHRLGFDSVGSTEAAVTFARDRNFEREAVVDERALLRDALQRSMGEAGLDEVKHELEHRLETGEFITIGRAADAPSRAITTQEMQQCERETIDMMRAGRGRHHALGGAPTAETIVRDRPPLSREQAEAVQHVLGSRDSILALEGVAGAGKTTTLAAVRTYAEQAGYLAEGLAPTSRAAQTLEESGIPSGTLQRHLTQAERADTQPRLWVLDEASLAGTRQMHQFFRGLGSRDRVLLVGDVRQHHGVEAGYPYQQLQDAGMDTARLDTILRQQDPRLLAVVEQLSRGEVVEAMRGLSVQGRVHAIEQAGERFQAIAREYLKDPEGTLVVSPDNQSRREINVTIHRAMQAAGHVEDREQRVRVLVPRQEMTGADRQWAERYAVGDVVRYSKGSRTHGIGAGEYGRVARVQGRDHLVTVKLQHSGQKVTYDPRRLHGVTLYREDARAFAVGDRVQLTAPDRARGVANRELGRVEAVDRERIQIRLDTGRALSLGSRRELHLDHGYAVTSHSSQGQTAERVLVHVDTERAHGGLITPQMAYVAISRGRHDARIYTNSMEQLTKAITHDHARGTALELGHVHAHRGPKEERQHAIHHGLGMGL